MISPAVTTVVSVGLSAVLAFWFVVTYRSLGPQTLRSSVLACAIACGLLELIQRTTAPLADVTNTAVTLLCLVVPVFGLAFWSCGVLVRAFVAEMHRR